MRMIKIANIALATLGLVASVSAFAAPEAKIEQLSWMTGNWAGALGPNQLEENLIGTDGRSLAAIVRITGDDATSMF